MSKWTIVRLEQSHDRSGFDCGNIALNEWIKSRASQFDRRDLSRTYVATKAGELLVCGYYAISTHRVVYEDLPLSESKGLPRIDVPVVLLGRLAVDQSNKAKDLERHCSLMRCGEQRISLRKLGFGR